MTVKLTPLMRMRCPIIEPPEKSLVLASEPITADMVALLGLSAVEEAAIVEIQLYVCR